MKLIRANIALLRRDEGLSLAETLLAIGLTGLLALGCTQLALASFTSARYTESVAVKSLNTGNANRLITSDMESAEGFLVPSSSSQGTNTVCSTTALQSEPGTTTIPLLALQNSNGSQIGYELRTSGSSGALWRVTCPTPGSATGPALMVRAPLPPDSSVLWRSAVQCASFPTGGTLTTENCLQDIWLNSISSNPGIVFTIPKTLSNGGVSTPSQSIVAGRNVG